LRAGKRHRGRRRGPRRPRFRLMTFLSLASRTGRSRRGISRRQLMGRPCRVLPRVSIPPNVQGSLDSSHRVEVHFVNAPPGMRSGLTKIRGSGRGVGPDPILDGWVELGGTNHIHLVPGSEAAPRRFSVTQLRIRNGSSCPKPTPMITLTNDEVGWFADIRTRFGGS
jgi:hypothetical protein